MRFLTHFSKIGVKKTYKQISIIQLGTLNERISREVHGITLNYILIYNGFVCIILLSKILIIPLECTKQLKTCCH